MRTITTLVLTLFFAQSAFGQKINYSSDMKYQKVRLVVKYPTLTKKSQTKEAEKIAFVQSPMVSNKKQIYGALVVKSK